MEKGKRTSFQLTQEALRLLRALARAQGVSMTAMLEIMIRETAERRGIK